MKRFTSKTQKIGKYGEKICKKYLKNSGFSIIEENYYNYYGEIDIIALKNNRLYFYEIKSIVSNPDHVSHETYNPYQNIHKKKIKKLKSCLFTYLKGKHVSHETWSLYACAIHIDYFNVQHRISFIKII